MTVSNIAEPWRAAYAHPGRWDRRFAPLTMPALLADATARHPNRPLVDFLGRTYSYADLNAEALAFAAWLQDHGIQRGDRIGLFLPNVPIYVPAYFGAMIAGAIAVNFSPLYTVEELAAQVADSGTRLLVTIDSAMLLPTALEVLESSELETLVVGSLAAMLPWYKGLALRLFGRKSLAAVPVRAEIVAWADALADHPPVAVTIDPAEDLALLQYTGGTTGVPKGAMLTHQNLTANARQIAAIDPEAGERDMIMGALPLFHVFANGCVLNRTVINGGCIAMVPRFDAGQVLATIARTRATSFPGVPTMFQALLDHPDLVRTDLSSLRACIAGGAPLPAPLKTRFEATSGVRLVEGYGLTETAGVVSVNPYEGDDRAGTIGQPLPGTRIRLLDKEDPEADAPAGEPGELAIQGPQVMRGYWRRPETARDAFAVRDDGRWLRTGDVALIDEDGYLHIVDRIKDMIAVGGFKVFPSQVEGILLQNPAVKEALVIGVPDPYRGESPRAYVTLRQGESTNAEALKSWLNARLGKHERVDEVVVRAALPKTMIGKLDRKALRAELARETVPG